MSAATFTPGPWTYSGHEDHHQEAGRPYHEVIDADGFEVVNQNGIITSEADARLIAAAPELLEACKLAYARLKPGDIRKDYSGHVAHVAMAKAIAKVEGSAD